MKQPIRTGAQAQRTLWAMACLTFPAINFAGEPGKTVSTPPPQSEEKPQTVKKVIVGKPLPGELHRLGIPDWPIWTREPGPLPWTYEDDETCYILEGEVTLEAEGQTVRFGPGDLVKLPKGLACVWKIEKAVKKHYRFGPFPVQTESAARPEEKKPDGEHPPGWGSWDEEKRKAWSKGVDWAKHVTAIRAEEAHLGVDFITKNLQFVEKATRRGADPKLVLDAFLKSLDTGKTPQEELRNLGVKVNLDP